MNTSIWTVLVEHFPCCPKIESYIFMKFIIFVYDSLENECQIWDQKMYRNAGSYLAGTEISWDMCQSHFMSNIVLMQNFSLWL